METYKYAIERASQPYQPKLGEPSCYDVTNKCIRCGLVWTGAKTSYCADHRGTDTTEAKDAKN